QQFARPEYFHPRPSAAGRGYDAAGSGGSNLGPTSKALVERTTADVEKVLAENPGLQRGRIPADMVTASASGLDPNISVANAYAQAARVAAARGVPESEIRGMIGRSITRRQFGILGEPRVNVLRLNLALDAMTKPRHS
ncbi:MAG: potassium-transporting ATPase subunit C, partial [Armatimonadetes bacterium]|nr:potassium-transporting ATPase subunit C [Armatimonadota bacterium]